MEQAFKFYARLDGLALSTAGSVHSWNGITTSPVAYYITPLGLLTDGLVVGQSDFWQYDETISNAGWVKDDL